MSAEKKQYRSFWLVLVSGMLTGMGNGSVFGAAVMCLMGRGGFASWGGDGVAAYNPATFTGFIDWTMIVFGLAFCLILYVGLGGHEKVESGQAA